MSITISELSFHYPNHDFLFEKLSFSVEKQSKVSIVGNNGTGKSTLLKLLSGQLLPVSGIISFASVPYYIPQYTGVLRKTVAEALRVSEKLAALQAIMQGSILQSDYDILADDWDIEARCISALAYWGLSHLALDRPTCELSGGEITKLFLAGILVHNPEIVLLDEPSNHLDEEGQTLLYQYIRQTNATLLVVSHDVKLLNQLSATYELSGKGIHLYGGNYSFYRAQKEIATHALHAQIHEQEKSLRLARRKAQEVKQQQEKRSSRSEKERMKGGVPRILANAKKGVAEETSARLKGKHAEIITDSQNKLDGLKSQRERAGTLKMDFDYSRLHSGKLLIEAKGINLAYSPQELLWEKPLDFTLFSNDRIRITGNNGTGKSTFISLLLGKLLPSCGTIQRADLEWLYLDQHYTVVDADCTIEEFAFQCNDRNLEEHEVKLRLNRYLFPSETWSRNCRALSGGEKMRLYLCGLMIRNHTPDLIVLDEPTNNLDISSLEILLQTLKGYKGGVLIVSHDSYFVEEIGITGELDLNSF